VSGKAGVAALRKSLRVQSLADVRMFTKTR
jgi:hypothetical protein